MLRHRELVHSKFTDIISATSIRGKCTVLLYCADVENYEDYLAQDDAFFYQYGTVYDPHLRAILTDRSDIKIGKRYQAEIPKLLTLDEQLKISGTKMNDELKWTDKNPLTEREIEQFLVISRSVGTFARALDCSNMLKQSVLTSAATASRDITLVSLLLKI